MDPGSILAHLTLNETLPNPQHPDPSRRQEHSETTLSSCAYDCTTRIHISNFSNEHERKDRYLLSIDEPLDYRQYALLRPCYPHLHPYWPLLSLRPRLPALSAYRFRKMGAEEEVPI